VVADREVTPVGRQRVVVGAEHAADVAGVVQRGVEVGVVGDRERQVELDVGERVVRPVVAARFEHRRPRAEVDDAVPFPSPDPALAAGQREDA
jgi:uncharacterized membrane protein